MSADDDAQRIRQAMAIYSLMGEVETLQSGLRRLRGLVRGRKAKNLIEALLRTIPTTDPCACGEPDVRTDLDHSPAACATKGMFDAEDMDGLNDRPPLTVRCPVCSEEWEVTSVWTEGAMDHTCPAEVCPWCKGEPHTLDECPVAAEYAAEHTDTRCEVCGGRIEYLDPTGDDLASWWAHEFHPEDGHDATPPSACGTIGHPTWGHDCKVWVENQRRYQDAP